MGISQMYTVCSVIELSYLRLSNDEDDDNGDDGDYDDDGGGGDGSG